MFMRLLVPAGILLLVTGIGCTTKENASASSSGETAATGTESGTGSTSTPEAAETAPVEMTGETVAWGGIQGTVPGGWTTETPSNSMRAAQYSLARAEGDSEDVEVVLTFFGKDMGGTLQDNKVRWAGMIEQEDGSPSLAAMKMENFDVGDYRVTIADLEGRYVGAISMMNPSAGRHNKPDYRVVNCIIAGDKGNHYVKVQGPKKSVAKWMPSVRAFLESVK